MKNFNPYTAIGYKRSLYGDALRLYLREHAKRVDSWTVRTHKPMYVFKKILVPERCALAIANLIIPADTLIMFNPERAFNLPLGSTGAYINDRKMRTERAYVHSIAEACTGKKHRTGYSGFDRSFKYRVGKTVGPNGFWRTHQVCAPGIHFFLNCSDAYGYSV